MTTEIIARLQLTLRICNVVALWHALSIMKDPLKRLVPE